MALFKCTSYMKVVWWFLSFILADDTYILKRRSRTEVPEIPTCENVLCFRCLLIHCQLLKMSFCEGPRSRGDKLSRKSNVFNWHWYWLNMYLFLKKWNIYCKTLSNSGDLLLWVGVRRRPSCVNIFFSWTTGPILTKLVCRICRVRTQEIVNFMTPTQRGGNFGVKV